MAPALTNNMTLKLTQDRLEPHALECVEFAKAIVEGRPSPVPAEQSLPVLNGRIRDTIGDFSPNTKNLSR